jgi:type 1 glutamine amidotransferase
LVVRGGWDGHSPIECTDEMIPLLAESGFSVEIAESLDVYLDAEKLAEADLVVQCWTAGEITREQADGLVSAVRAGTGFAGWHGGIIDSFHGSLAYQRLTGAQFMYHPPGFVDYDVVVRPGRADHEIVQGINSVHVCTEKYWVLSDGLNDVLADCTFSPTEDSDWRQPVVMPVVWTRHWSNGRVFVNAVGHRVEDLQIPEIRTITHRGMLWASR